MAEFIEQYQIDIRQFDYIAPLPLFSARFRERGYNQSLLLAQELVNKLSLGPLAELLVKTRHTKTQTDLSQKERWTNIYQAFRIKPSVEVHGKNILIVDDLLTTGATASEAARCLKEAGANTVGIVTLAIATFL